MESTIALHDTDNFTGNLGNQMASLRSWAGECLAYKYGDGHMVDPFFKGITLTL